jgi:hypothetical protein
MLLFGKGLVTEEDHPAIRQRAADNVQVTVADGFGQIKAADLGTDRMANRMYPHGVETHGSFLP